MSDISPQTTLDNSTLLDRDYEVLRFWQKHGYMMLRRCDHGSPEVSKRVISVFEDGTIRGFTDFQDGCGEEFIESGEQPHLSREGAGEKA